MTEEEKTLFKTYYDHNQQLIRENAELKKKTDPTPEDHATWRRETYAKLEEAAKKNVETEVAKVLAANDELKAALEKTEAEAQFCRRKWEEADAKRRHNADEIKRLHEALYGASKGIRRLRRWKYLVRLFNLAQQCRPGWVLSIQAPREDLEDAS